MDTLARWEDQALLCGSPYFEPEGSPGRGWRKAGSDAWLAGLLERPASDSDCGASTASSAGSLGSAGSAGPGIAAFAPVVEQQLGITRAMVLERERKLERQLAALASMAAEWTTARRAVDQLEGLLCHLGAAPAPVPAPACAGAPADPAAWGAAAGAADAQLQAFASLVLAEQREACDAGCTAPAVARRSPSPPAACAASARPRTVSCDGRAAGLEPQLGAAHTLFAGGLPGLMLPAAGGRGAACTASPLATPCSGSIAASRRSPAPVPPQVEPSSEARTTPRHRRTFHGLTVPRARSLDGSASPLPLADGGGQRTGGWAPPAWGGARFSPMPPRTAETPEHSGALRLASRRRSAGGRMAMEPSAAAAGVQP
ncbi:hypothetical protein HT031_004699 [Scenedesmus sp. PABB004]|nr:hypothetical protein HT031_004699 [Scenedesmus sp. PABB004]